VEACDVVVGENTCDGKKKAYEILSPLLNDFYVIDLPQMKSEAGEGAAQTGICKIRQKTRRRKR